MQMEIEGMTASTGPQGEVLVPEGRGSWRCIRVVPSDSGGSVVELVEGGEQPGIAEGERVPLMERDAAIEARIVRALAVLHLRLPEAACHSTEADSAMVSRGFSIGRSSFGQPVWILPSQSAATVIARTEEGGLPDTLDEPVFLLFSTLGDGRRVSVKAENLATALKLHDSSQVPAMLHPVNDVEIDGLLDVSTVTRH